MQAYIFKNTDESSTWLALKSLMSLSKLGTEFIAVFDKHYDIIDYIPKLYQKIYYANTTNVTKLIQDNCCRVIDFELSMFEYNCSNYQELLEKLVCPITEKIDLNLETDLRLDNLIAGADKNQYTDIYIAVQNAPYYKICHSILEDIANLIECNNSSIFDQYYLISKCSFVVCDNHIEYLIARELNKPCFVICQNAFVAHNEKKENKTVVFDPFRGEKQMPVPGFFVNDKLCVDRYNSQIIQPNKVEELLTLELKDSLNKFKIPYVTPLTS